MPRPRPHRVALDLRGLMGTNDIFRLSGAVKRDPHVDMWLSDRPPELRSIAQVWFAQMRQCGEDVRELIHDGCPVACVDDAPFGYVNAFTSHVNIGFFCGAELHDSAGLLEGKGKRMRHVKCKPGSETNAAALRDLVGAAYMNVRTRVLSSAHALHVEH
jgi:hypothetical protein